MSIYRDILKQSWLISWKHKHLWFFGLFASLLAVGAEYKIIGGAMGQDAETHWSNLKQIFTGNWFNTGFFSNLVLAFKNNTGPAISLVLIMLIILAIIVFLIWMAVVSQAAIVDETKKIINNGADTPEESIKNGIISGRKHFWPVFGANILIKIVVEIVLVLISLPLISTMLGYGVSSALYIILFIVLVPVAISFSLVMKYAIAYNVTSNTSFCDSLKNAWGLFKRNWIISVEMAFALFFISFAATVAIMLATGILAIPFIILAAAFFTLFSFAAFWSIAVIAMIALITFIVVCGCVLSVFQTAAWTDIFLRLQKKPHESKIERIFKAVVKKSESK